LISFFKSKPKLVDLIPAGFIDIHSHLLPGIDDGAKSIEDTSEMLLQLKSIGFEKCITTPHSLPGVWENTKEGILTTFIQTKSELPESTSEMLHITASEYMMNETFHERIQTDELLTIKDNLVLVEMSYLNPPLALLDIIFELKLKGYQPILAHPERYFFYHQNQKMYKTLKELDVLFQLNLLSVVGYYGSSVAIIADRLLKENLIDFVGSDVHHMQHVNSFQNKIIIKSEKKLIEAIERNSILK
jgi:tyrosine-protein phosphatase YwqE